MMANPAVAQNHRVLHVWVDPHNGDDAQALASTPPQLQCAPTDTHPHNVQDSNQAPLLHASAPFRTVTAAINYIRQIHPNGLPMTQPNTGIVTEQVVIHCLPGLYGPSNLGTDLHTGLAFNGETLPIVLPDRVSIQGTNALNTVFVADGEHAVFEFGNAANAFAGHTAPEMETLPRQFLASIAITGAIRELGYGGIPHVVPSVPEKGAGIFVDKQRRTSLLVTNCVIYCNATGLLVDDVPAPPPGTDPVAGMHAIHLINNTFAWNVCGIWTGQIDRLADPALVNPSLGLSLLCLVNNLFDATPPLRSYPPGLPRAVEVPLFGAATNLPAAWDRWIQALSQPTGNGTLLGVNVMTDFEGVDPVDTVTAGANAIDFNGYEANKWNVSSALINPGGVPASSVTELSFLGLHQTTERSGRGPGPSRDLGPFTGEGVQQRGIVFVRDLLHEGGRTAADPFFAGGDARFDRCVGDFRLAPGVRFAGVGTAGTPPGQCNPFVDAGFTFQNDANGNPIPLLMQNALATTPDPFALDVASEASFPHTPWDWDCEGFGNVRVFDHPVYPSVPTPPAGITQTTDLGADELDLLIVAGMRETTTTFIAQSVTQVSGVNDIIWFLCAREGLQGAATAGGTVPAVTPDFTPVHSDYPAQGNWTPGAPSAYYVPGWVDTVPHLLPDIHPWWIGIAPSSPTNIEWRSQTACTSNQYNPALYLNPSVGIINPIGGGIPSQPAFAAWNWLDDQYWTLFSGGVPYVPVTFMNEDGSGAIPGTRGLTNRQATGTDWLWCALHDAAGVVQPLSPSSNPRLVANPAANTLRVSCEWLKPNAPFDNQRGGNLQSIMIWR